MRLCRFGSGSLGVVDGPTVRDVTAALDVLPACSYPLPSHDLMIANLDRVIERARAIAADAPPLPLANVRLLSPVANPGKIVCAPVNYQKHLDEVRDQSQLNHGNQGHTAPIHPRACFSKRAARWSVPGEGIALRKLDRRNDHEVELAVVIGREAKDVSRHDALGTSPAMPSGSTSRFADPRSGACASRRTAMRCSVRGS